MLRSAATQNPAPYSTGQPFSHLKDNYHILYYGQPHRGQPPCMHTSTCLSFHHLKKPHAQTVNNPYRADMILRLYPRSLSAVHSRCAHQTRQEPHDSSSPPHYRAQPSLTQRATSYTVHVAQAEAEERKTVMCHVI